MKKITIPPEIEKQLDVLRLFNRKADQLRQKGFVARYKDEIPCVTLHFKGVAIEQINENGLFAISGKIDSELDDFSRDEVDSVVLSYRMFTQDNDAISIRRIAAIYTSDWIPEDGKAHFEKARLSFNEYLDSAATVEFEKYQISIRYICDVIIYGGLAHSNPDKECIFNQWQKVPARGMLWVEFYAFLRFAVNTIFHIAEMNTWLIENAEKHGFSEE